MTGDRGGYTFHLPNGREKDDLNLAQPIMKTVLEQIRDTDFVMEWAKYERRNKNCSLAYYRHIYNLEKECEQDGVHPSAA